jgi:hypothetical protein
MVLLTSSKKSKNSKWLLKIDKRDITKAEIWFFGQFKQPVKKAGKLIRLKTTRSIA